MADFRFVSFWATCGVILRLRSSLTKSAVSYPLSPPRVMRRVVRGSCFTMLFAASRSPVPDALVTSGLIVKTEVTKASGTGEREAAKSMVKQLPRTTRRITLGGDKGYDTADFVRELRSLKITPHVAQNDTNRKSAIDGRTTSHPNYAISLRIRKRIEEGFGWMKTVGRIRKTMYRGIDKIAWQLNLHAAAYNLVRMKNLGLGAT